MRGRGEEGERRGGREGEEGESRELLRHTNDTTLVGHVHQVLCFQALTLYSAHLQLISSTTELLAADLNGSVGAVGVAYLV